MITRPSSELRDGEATREGKSDRAVRALATALARRCRGRTLVYRVPDAGFTALMRARHPDVEAGILSAGGAPGREGCPARTVVLVGVLEDLQDAEARRRLAEAWELLAPGGRLLVVVPNPESGEDSKELRTFDRRSLTRLLRELGKPRLATDQPYRWLTMYVSKPRQARPRENRTRRDRYRVAARLCKGRVIELGCGEGHLARSIADRAEGHEVIGVDISRDKISRARAAFPDLEFIECDIARLSLPDASFDTAVLAEVLEHVDEALGAVFLARAWRLLRPHGRLIVSVPNEDCIPHRNHVRVFDRRSLRALLRPLGRPKLVTDQPYKWLLMYVDKA
jgi:SAM-dependent methyltransferase